MIDVIEDDPVLGAFVAHFPSNRARLLLIGGGALVVIWFVVTVALWQVEAVLASTLTVGILSVATLAAGWYIAHLWNREVILYERGFSYREGSNLAFIHYADVTSLRQNAERIAYFGGLVRRVTYRAIIKTTQDETIILNNVYNRVEELSIRMEQALTLTLKPGTEQALQAGQRVAFGDSLALSADGLHEGARTLPWTDLDSWAVRQGRLIFHSKSGGEWYTIPIGEVDNIRLLLDLLPRLGREHRA